VVSVVLAERDSELEIGDMLSEHGPVLLAAARLITLNEAEAQDVVQVTFEIALRRGHTLRDPESLRAWLLVIEAREAVRRVRSMRRFLSFGPHVHDLASSEPGHDQSLALRDGLRALPRACAPPSLFITWRAIPYARRRRRWASVRTRSRRN